MLPISLVYGVLVDCVSKLPHRQSTIHYRSILLLTTTILQCPSERSNELISLWSKCNALRTIYRPSESISPMDIRFCFVVQSTTPQSATRLEQNTAMRLKLWAIGYGILVIGDWLWNMGGIAAIRASTPYTLRFTLLAPLPLTFRLIASSPHRL